MSAQTPVPAPVPPQTAAPKPKPPAVSPERRIAEADSALARNDLPTARTIYRELLESGGFDHAGWVRLAEGLYRARAFSDALRAFERAGGLRSGEEPYHFYMAVALYETGRYDDAKRELAVALPFIEVTPDVARYRAKIEGAID
jgi:tetratricopeptide (TPR) repeat protein